MLEKSYGLLFDKLVHHIAQDGSNGIEALVGLADVCKTNVIQQDLLDNEDGNGFTELGTRLHDAQAQRDDFGCQEEIDDLGRIILDESANDTKRRQTKIFKWTGLGCRIEKWIEEQRNVR